MAVECAIPEMLLGRRLCLGFDIRDSMDRILYATNTEQYKASVAACPGIVRFEATIPHLCLAPGHYRVYLYLGDGRADYEVIPDAAAFDVTWEPQVDIAFPPRASWGPVFQRVLWEVKIPSVRCAVEGE